MIHFRTSAGVWRACKVKHGWDPHHVAEAVQRLMYLECYGYDW